MSEKPSFFAELKRRNVSHRVEFEEVCSRGQRSTNNDAIAKHAIMKMKPELNEPVR